MATFGKPAAAGENYMHYKHHYLLPVFLVLAALMKTVPAHADGTVSLQADEHHAGVVTMVGPRGFITRLQTVDTATLTEQVQVLRSQLIARKQQLVEEVDEKQLDSGDALLTIIMPGGLLYAGYRKAALERARHDLAEVSDDITEYSRDLSVLADKTTVTVALQ
jgi:hypothetical protein